MPTTPPKTASKRPRRSEAIRRPAHARATTEQVADWHRRVIDRSLRSATKKSIDKGASLIRAATTLLERSNGDGFTVQEVADEAGQSLRTLYQYFESKDDLLLAVFEEAKKVYARMIRDVDRLDRRAARAPGRRGDRRRAHARAQHRRRRRRAGPAAAQAPRGGARAGGPLPGAGAVGVPGRCTATPSAAGGITDRGREQSVYIVTALNSAFITSQTLGNEYGLALPDPLELARFCLQGLGAERDDAWYDAVGRQVQLPPGPLASTPAGSPVIGRRRGGGHGRLTFRAPGWSGIATFR